MTIKPFSRSERFGIEIQKILGEIFYKEINTSSIGFITITEVKMTNDLKIAKIYISSINSLKSEDSIVNFFNKRSKYIRGFLGKYLTSKSVPELRFFYDNTEFEAEKIEKLFKKLKKDPK
tara:strand:+ start:5647 stop:6006 length:360 start_codon:yes stop_codon:yes gene_type:complete